MAADRARRGAGVGTRRTALRLQARLWRRRRLQELLVQLPELRPALRILLPLDPDSLLDELAAAPRSEAAPGSYRAGEEHLPYWATPWPSGFALARVIARQEQMLRGRRVIELGCGLGITAAVAGRCGASILAVDCFSEALLFCAANVARNAGRRVDTRCVDWRTESGREALGRRAPFDVVLAADVLYEAEDIDPLLELVPRLLAGGSGGQFWLAEPGRLTSAAFLERARAWGWPAETTELHGPWPAGGGTTVRVHRYRPAAPLDATFTTRGRPRRRSLS